MERIFLKNSLILSKNKSLLYMSVFLENFLKRLRVRKNPKQCFSRAYFVLKNYGQINGCNPEFFGGKIRVLNPEQPL